ncbi:MAG: RNA polymerase sigma factor [Polyangiaceae bacterium]
MDAPSPSRTLLGFVAQGDLRAAGEWLVANHARDVIGLCRSMVRERDLAEDLAQDVFSQAFTSLRAFRGEASPRTWLLTIARNRCIDHLRRVRSEPWDDGGDESEPDRFADDAPLAVELLSQRGDVGAALAELAEGERALVVLRFRHGLEYPELASVFGLREGTVRMRLSRALSKMRDHLEAREGQAELAESEAPLAPRGRAAAPPLVPAPARARIAPPGPAAPPAPASRPSMGGMPPPGAPPLVGPPPPPAAFGGPPAPGAAPPPRRRSARRWPTMRPPAAGHTATCAAPAPSSSTGAPPAARGAGCGARARRVRARQAARGTGNERSRAAPGRRAARPRRDAGQPELERAARVAARALAGSLTLS